MFWGVKVNVAEPRRAMRRGALCWVMNINPGGGSDRVQILARSRNGRLIETWIASKYLTNFRVAWLPEHLRIHCYIWETKERASEWAATIESIYSKITHSL